MTTQEQNIEQENETERKIIITIKGTTKGYKDKTGIIRFFKPKEQKVLSLFLIRNMDKWKLDIKEVLK